MVKGLKHWNRLVVTGSGDLYSGGIPAVVRPCNSRSFIVANLGNNCWNRHNDTMTVVAGPLQWKCDRCSGRRESK
ncbi:hypothetical protein HAX54_021866, partial [Datura stramonium]|nr:hypothetical protein [Datura stramonium]